MTFAMCGVSLSQSGFWVNMIDISPKYSGHLMGISNTFASIAGIIGNVATGMILDATGQWSLVFLKLISIYMIAMIFFVIFATGDVVFV